MLLNQIFAIACICSALFGAHLLSDQVIVPEIASPLMLSLRPKKPNWQHEVTSRYESGSAKTALLVEKRYQERGKAALYPVKLLHYYEDGAIASESDLFSDDVKKYVLDGCTVSFYEDGKLCRIALFNKGKKEGLFQEFYPNGRLKCESEWKNGAKHGSEKEYAEDGTMRFCAEYVQGKLQGDVIDYNASFEKVRERHFEGGLLHGLFLEWYPASKKIFSEKQYVQGVLSDKKTTPAVQYFYENGPVKEIQHVQLGVLHGKHVRFFENGKEAYAVEYVQGKKDGVERFFAEDGSLLGECLFRQGIPSGKHEIKYSNGVVQSIACYDEHGNLVEPKKEFDRSGKCIKEYMVRDGKLDGDYIERFASGAIKKQLHYRLGKLHGEQKELYPHAKPLVVATYIEGKPDGEYLEFYDNGKMRLRYHFTKAMLDGTCESWYPNGVLQEEASYINNVLDGQRLSFFENGNMASEIHFASGKKHGKHTEWDEFGNILLQEEWVDDLLHGPYKSLYPNGALHHEVAYVHGKKNGKELSFYENGQKALEAFYENGALHGTYESFFEDGKPHQMLRSIHGKPEGEQKEYYPTDPASKKSLFAKIQQYTNGLLQGEQKQYYPNGQLKASISYDKGLLSGKKQLFLENGTKILDATYSQGKLEGKVFQRRVDGSEMVQYFKDGIPDGLLVQYYTPHEVFGKVKAQEASYIQGLLEGEYSEYNPQGIKILSMFFKNGKRDGLATYYGDDGKVVMTANFKNGKQDGNMVTYYPTGSVHKKATFVADLQEGEELSFFEDGKKQAISFFKGGKLHGLCKQFAKDGTLLFEGEYENGLKHGIFNKYFPDGTPHILQRFKRDILQSKEVFEPKASKR